jgi:regulator of protease activity HflC (stomatin/prohibitin superfamily)
MPEQLIYVAAALVVGLILLLLSAVRILWQYERGVVFRFGKMRGERAPGLNLNHPFYR